MKLIRVMDGLYRSEDGSVRVAYQLPLLGKPAHWTVRYKTFFSDDVVKEFRTLAEVRKFLSESEAFNP